MIICFDFPTVESVVTINFFYFQKEVSLQITFKKIHFLFITQSLRLSNTAFSGTTVGQVVNLLSNDVNRLDTALLFLHFSWISPLQTIVATYFIWQEIGVSSLVGLAACFLFISFQGLY